MEPRFIWTGSIGEKSGRARFEVGGNAIELNFPDFTSAHQISNALLDAYRAGHSDAVSAVRRVTNRVLDGEFGLTG